MKKLMALPKEKAICGHVQNSCRPMVLEVYGKKCDRTPRREAQKVKHLLDLRTRRHEKLVTQFGK